MSRTFFLREICTAAVRRRLDPGLWSLGCTQCWRFPFLGGCALRADHAMMMLDPTQHCFQVSDEPTVGVVGEMMMAMLGGRAGSWSQIAAVAVQNVARTDVGAAV